MKKTEIKISYEAEKLAATRQYMTKKDADLLQELEDAIGKLYEKYVPAPVREYIECSAKDEAAAKQKSQKQPIPPRPIARQVTPINH